MVFGGIQAVDTEFPYGVPIVDRRTNAAPLFAALVLILAHQNRTIAPLHRNAALLCLVSEIASSDFWGPRWASQSQIAEIAAISVR